MNKKGDTKQALKRNVELFMGKVKAHNNQNSPIRTKNMRCFE
jgi:hypothetical protein